MAGWLAGLYVVVTCVKVVSISVSEQHLARGLNLYIFHLCIFPLFSAPPQLASLTDRQIEQIDMPGLSIKIRVGPIC